MARHRSSIRKKDDFAASPKPSSDPFQPRPFADPAVDEITHSPANSAPPILDKLVTPPPRSVPIQPKLTIGAPGDRYEQEADRLASQVVQQIHGPQTNHSVQREAIEDEELQMKPNFLQRESIEDDEELQMRPATEAVEGGPASKDLESAIHQARGSGQALDPNLQRQMGQALGADFSGITIHTDSQSDQLNRSIQAKAFTTGQDIFFRQGAYQPSSQNGQELIAHELTHVVQQGKETTLRRSPNAVQRDMDEDLRKAILSRRGLATGQDSETTRREQAQERHTAMTTSNERQQQSGELHSFLKSNLRKRRGMVTGQSSEEVSQEFGLEDFTTSAGKRATEEAQGVSGDPMMDRIALQEKIATRGALGSQGLATLMNQNRQREVDKASSFKDLSDTHNEQLDSHRQGRQAIDKAVWDYGEPARLKAVIEHESKAQQANFSAMLKDALSLANNAKLAASWDTTELEKLSQTAQDSFNAIAAPLADTIDAIAPRVQIAQTAIVAVNLRANQDLDWMNQLQPRTEADIISGVERFKQGDTTIINTNMSQAWASILSNGGQSTRDTTLLDEKFKELAKEIDRKTPIDENSIKQSLTGNPSQKNTALDLLKQKITSNKKSTISKIIASESNAKTLTGYANQLDELDGFNVVLENTTDRGKLAQILQKSKRNLPALLRIYKAYNNDANKVHFLLCGNGGQEIINLEDWLKKNGKVWTGDTTNPPAFQPTGTTRDQIENVAVPKTGSSSPAAGGYAGNRAYGTNTQPPDMLLPQQTTTKQAITYTEYDIKPYHPGQNRGGERFVKGSDGRYYYTSDHYKTFKQFT
ncbi:MAG: DUF4157 domain-containing protein [Spirulina sp.]